MYALLTNTSTMSTEIEISRKKNESSPYGSITGLHKDQLFSGWYQDIHVVWMTPKHLIAGFKMAAFFFFFLNKGKNDGGGILQVVLDFFFFKLNPSPTLHARPAKELKWPPVCFQDLCGEVDHTHTNTHTLASLSLCTLQCLLNVSIID